MTRRTQVRHEHVPLVPQDTDTTRAGTTVRVRGRRGTFRVLAEVRTHAGAEWTELVQDNHGCFNVRPDTVIWPRKKRGEK